MGALSCYRAASRGAWEGSIDIAGSGASRAVRCTTKVLEFSPRAALANSCLSIHSTRLAVGKAPVTVYDLQVSSPAPN